MLVLANKQDVKGAMSPSEIEQEIMRGIPSLSGAIVHGAVTDGDAAAAIDERDAGDGETSKCASSLDTRANSAPGSQRQSASEPNDTITHAALPPLTDAATADFQSSGRRHWRVGACSAVSGAGLLEHFDWLIGDIGSRIFMFD